MRLVLVILLLLLILGAPVYAHPGNTDSSGGHHCYTDCASWGLSYGEYHYHDGPVYYQETTSSQQEQLQTMVDEYYSSGYDRGYSDGKEDGESKGYDDGYLKGERTGFNNGKEIGIKNGYDTGYDEGYSKGKVELEGHYKSLNNDLKIAAYILLGILLISFTFNLIQARKLIRINKNSPSD